MSRKAPQNAPAPAAVQPAETPETLAAVAAPEVTAEAQEAAAVESAAVVDAAPEQPPVVDPIPDEVAQKAPESGAETALVRAVHGDMVHLFTNQVLTSEPKQIELDAYVRGQIAAGKLEVVAE